MRRKRLRRLALMYPSIQLGYPFVPLKIKSNYTLKDYQARQSFLFCTLRFLESPIRKNHYVQNTHSCSKNAVIGKQPLRSGNVEFEIMKQNTLGTKYARTYQEVRRQLKLIGVRLLRSGKLDFENYELAYVMCKIRKRN